MSDAIIVFTTTPNEDEARSLAGLIVERRLAACVQVLPRMTSVYVWDGAVQTEAEHLLLIKTLQEKFDELAEFIRSNHTYTVPEIVAVRAEGVSESYFKWINETVAG
jgi:periplasmic divalent cation tolerance protein